MLDWIMLDWIMPLDMVLPQAWVYKALPDLTHRTADSASILGASSAWSSYYSMNCCHTFLLSQV